MVRKRCLFVFVIFECVALIYSYIYIYICMAFGLPACGRLPVLLLLGYIWKYVYTS